MPVLEIDLQSRKFISIYHKKYLFSSFSHTFTTTLNEIHEKKKCCTTESYTVKYCSLPWLFCFVLFLFKLSFSHFFIINLAVCLAFTIYYNSFNGLNIFFFAWPSIFNEMLVLPLCVSYCPMQVLAAKKDINSAVQCCNAHFFRYIRVCNVKGLKKEDCSFYICAQILLLVLLSAKKILFTMR